jgi:hypothetical protein
VVLLILLSYREYTRMSFRGFLLVQLSAEPVSAGDYQESTEGLRVKSLLAVIIIFMTDNVPQNLKNLLLKLEIFRTFSPFSRVQFILYELNSWKWTISRKYIDFL